MKTLSLAVVAALLAAEVPAQFGNPSRTWAFLAAKYDEDGSGEITEKEYPRGDRQFDNLDRDGDGKLTRRDCEVGSQFRLQQSLSVRADADRDRVVTRTEWQELCSMLQQRADGAYDVQGFLEAVQWVRPRRQGRRARLGVGGGNRKGGGGGRGRHRQQRLQSVLDAVDTDGDGGVTPSDLVGLFEWLDSNGDDALGEAEVYESHGVVRRPPAKTPDPTGGPGKGMTAPDFELPDAREPSKTVRLAKLCDYRPVVLVFGSYTDPVFRSSVRELSDIFDRHRDEVCFLLVYLREAHAIDSYSPGGFEVVEDPITDNERIALAERCVAALELPWLTVVDRIDDRVGEAYGAWPERVVLLGRDREVLFASRPGAGNFELDGLGQAIKSALARKP